MKKIAIASSAIVCLGVLGVLQLASQVSGDSSVPSASATSAKAESIIGKVSALDTNAGTFDVRSSDGKVVHLKGSNGVTPHQLRRGERVIVTYADGVALTIKATRNEKSP